MKIKHFVRQSLFFSLFLGGMGLAVSIAHAEPLPDIEAHQFKIVPLEKSRTGRVYRFKTEAEQLPHTGSILLIQEYEKPIMAFRVLKTDFDHSEFIAKRVRRYDATSELKINERYVTVEKLADLVTPPQAETSTYNPNAKPMMDPNPTTTPAAGANTAPPQLDPFTDNGAASGDATTTALPGDPNKFTPAAPNASGNSMNVEKYDDDLDSSTSPTNLKNDQSADTVNSGNGAMNSPDAPILGDVDNEYDLEVKERVVYQPYKNMISFGVASLRNMSNESLSGSSTGGFTLAYSQVIKRNLVFKKASPQDSLSTEFGFGYYTNINVNGHSDEYDVLPIKAELRYDIHLSEAFTLFGYFGAQYNLVFATANLSTAADQTALDQRRGPQANIGVGILYNIGPQWYIRGDLGLDRIGIGLAIRW